MTFTIEDAEERITCIEICLDVLFDHLRESYPEDPIIEKAWIALGL